MTNFDLSNPAHLGMIASMDKSGVRKMTDEERDAIARLTAPSDYLNDLKFKAADDDKL